VVRDLNPARDAASTEHRPGDQRSRRWPFAIGGLATLALIGARAAAIVPRVEHHRELNSAAAAASARLSRVSVAAARAMASSEERVLPGNAVALFEAGLFPRATGYIKTRQVDIGDHVE